MKINNTRLIAPLNTVIAVSLSDHAQRRWLADPEQLFAVLDFRRDDGAQGGIKGQIVVHRFRPQFSRAALTAPGSAPVSR